MDKIAEVRTYQSRAYYPNQEDTFDLVAFEQKLKNEKIRLVSMAYTSNITGYTIPAKEIIAIAHKYGAKVLLDGAQTLPHKTVMFRIWMSIFWFSPYTRCAARVAWESYVSKKNFWI